MELRDLDLNLLVVFRQLMIERRVSRAAESLGLTQPAVSNALARLRERLGDRVRERTAQADQGSDRARAFGQGIKLVGGGFSRILFPLLALAFVLISRAVLVKFQHVNFLNLAVPLLTAFADEVTALQAPLREGVEVLAGRVLEVTDQRHRRCRDALLGQGRCHAVAHTTSLFTVSCSALQPPAWQRFTTMPSGGWRLTTSLVCPKYWVRSAA